MAEIIEKSEQERDTLKFDQVVNGLRDEIKERIHRILSKLPDIQRTKYKATYVKRVKTAWLKVIDAIAKEHYNALVVEEYFAKREKEVDRGLENFWDNPFFFSRANIPQNWEEKEKYFDWKIKKIEWILQEYRKSNRKGRKRIQGIYPIETMGLKSSQDPNITFWRYQVWGDDHTHYKSLKFLREGAFLPPISSSEWAENTNNFFLTSKVLKTTKAERHGDDYYSNLQLMLQMLRVERDFNVSLSWTNEELQVHVQTATQGFGITKDKETWLYHRDIIQDFAEGREIDVALKEAFRNKFYYWKAPWNHTKQLSAEDFKKGCDEGIPLFIAYKKFLAHVQAKWVTDGYLLDITDSRQWFSQKRGNVLSTSNIFVKQDGRDITFTVIDPDVFNTDWHRKFSSRDVFDSLQKKGFTYKEALKRAGKVLWINGAREIVRGDMESYLSEILDGQDTTWSRRRLEVTAKQAKASILSKIHSTKQKFSK